MTIIFKGIDCFLCYNNKEMLKRVELCFMLEYILFFSVIATISFVPIIGPYISMFNTMVHESAHALVATLTGGQVVAISIFRNTSGLAEFRHRSWFGRVLTYAAGYPLASVFSVAYLYALSMDLFLYVGMVIFLLLAYNLFFWVRNLVGWIWVLTVILGLSFLYYNEYMYWYEIVLDIIGLSLLVQAFITCWIIFVLSVKQRDQAGDTTMLAKSTFLPASFWGFIFLAQGTVFFIMGSLIWFGFDPVKRIIEIVF